MVKYEEILVIGDIILETGIFYRIEDINLTKNTIDLRCYNKPLFYRAVPISNLYESEIEILKKLPENITFLRL